MSRNKLTTEEFIKRAKEVHGDKYDYSKVVYKNNKETVCIICKEDEHGEFYQTPASHLKGCGCPKCNRGSKKLTTEDFIKRAKKVHGDLYDYSKLVYKGSKERVCIICKEDEHREFYQIPGDHLKGHGCPRCSGMIKLTTEEFIKEAKSNPDKYNPALYAIENILYTSSSRSYDGFKGAINIV